MNNKKVWFEGIIPAIFSVYDEDMNIKKDTVRKLVNYQLENGVTGFYVGGATGECNVLPVRTRIQMLETVVEANQGRGKIIAHVGAAYLEDVYRLIDHANDLQVDCIASLPPNLSTYYKSDAVLEYYSLVAKRSKMPIMSYINNSAFQGDLYTFGEALSKIDAVMGIKVTVPDYYAFNRIKRIDGGRLNILNGPDEMMLCGLSMGGDGAIGSTYNILPKLAVSIYDAFKRGDNVAALESQSKLNQMIAIGLSGGNIAYWKAMMTLMGYDMGYTVAPAKVPTKEVLDDLKAKLEIIGFFELI